MSLAAAPELARIPAGEFLMGRRSVGLCGSWRDELDALRKGRAALEEERKQFLAKNVIGFTF